MERPDVISAGELRALYQRRAFVPVPGTGKTVEIRAVDFVGLILTGPIAPETRDGLIANVERLQRLKAREREAWLMANVALLGDLIDVVVCAAAVNPRITQGAVPDVDAIHVTDLHLMTKFTIFQAATALIDAPAGTVSIGGDVPVIPSAPAAPVTQPTPDSVAELITA